MMEEATRIGGTRMPRRQRRPRDGQRHGASLLSAPPIRNSLKPIDILSQDQVAAIDEAALTLLQETGIEFMGPAARDLLRRAGASVNDETGLVRIPRELVAQGLKTAPASFVLTPRNEQRKLHVGSDHVSFGLVAGPPNVHDCVNGRRSGTYPDYCNLIN